MRQMVKKRDLILIALLGLVAGTLLWVLPMLRRLPPPEAKLYMRYRINGEEPVVIPLTEERELTVKQEETVSNTFRLSPAGFSMASSTCKNQLCVYQGEVTAENMAERPMYNIIVCAPHRLVAELMTAEEMESMAREE